MKTTRGAMNIPSAIIIAAAIIAIAIIYVKKPVTPEVQTLKSPSQNAVADVNLAPITNTDHILGNPDAPIKIVEYSDPSCPYCKEFHPTMRQVMQEYGASGKVAWVYRHYTLDKARDDGFILHPNAGREAQSFECAAELGGNQKFWDYINKFYEVTPAVTSGSPKGLDPAQIPIIAKSVGLDGKKLVECTDSGKYKNLVDEQYLDGVNAGVDGTPTSFIITPTGSKLTITGAQPYSVLHSTIETLLTSVQ